VRTRKMADLIVLLQEFVASVDDLRSWMAEKNRAVQDESYRDLNNLERKLQKHEAFERELRANEGRLRSINKVLPSCRRWNPSVHIVLTGR
jgi:Spectrin repeat